MRDSKVSLPNGGGVERPSETIVAHLVHSLGVPHIGAKQVSSLGANVWSNRYRMRSADALDKQG
jgi:hypothetical protein